MVKSFAGTGRVVGSFAPVTWPIGVPWTAPEAFRRTFLAGLAEHEVQDALAFGSALQHCTGASIFIVAAGTM